VEPDDWFFPACAPDEWRELYACETVERRRKWFENLRALGRV
jgi:hypothetical protein